MLTAEWLLCLYISELEISTLLLLLPTKLTNSLTDWKLTKFTLFINLPTTASQESIPWSNPIAPHREVFHATTEGLLPRNLSFRCYGFRKMWFCPKRKPFITFDWIPKITGNWKGLLYLIISINMTRLNGLQWLTEMSIPLAQC